jgi:hypothetical protein
MKKSAMYKMAQFAVLTDGTITHKDKLEILRELMDKEYVALFVERQEEKEKAVEG